MMNREISIIIPVYNVCTYLNECIDSVLNQSYSNFELILIDDGSTDGSSDLCDAYLENDSRIKVIHKENGGVSSARNMGIKEANGKWICFIDSDDWIDREYLKILMQGEHADMSIVSLICEYPESKVYHKFKHIGYFNKEGLIGFINDDLPNLGALSPCGKLYRRDIINEFGIAFREDINFAEDAIFNLNYYLRIKTALINDEALYHYRTSGTGLTGNLKNHHAQFANTTNIIIGLIDRLEKIYGKIDSNHVKSTITLQFYVREFKYASSINRRKECIEVLKKIAECDSFRLNFHNYPSGIIGKKGKLLNWLFRTHRIYSIWSYIKILKGLKIEPI